MDYSDFKLLQLLLFFGVALGFGVWQWVSVRRSLQRDREKARNITPDSAQIDAFPREAAPIHHETDSQALEKSPDAPK